MADCWTLMERARSTVIPMLVFILALYLPRIQKIYAQNMPKIDMVMKVVPEHCLEGQTLILYCNINGLSSVSQYEVNWTKGIRVSHNIGVALVALDRQRTHKATWGDSESDSITYTLKVENITLDDTAIYTCQIFYRSVSLNHGSSAWDTLADSAEITVHETSSPLPQCRNSLRTNTKFYMNEQVIIDCLSRVDGVTLSWYQYNINGIPNIISEEKNTMINSLNLPAEESLDGATFVCSQYQPSGGSCIFGPIHILPAPTRLPTTTLPTTTYPPTTIYPTTLGKTTTEPTLPKLFGYLPDGIPYKVNQTEPTDKLTDSNICPEFVYVLVPTIIAVISILLNVYLVLRLRSDKHSKIVDKICENKLCVTRERSGTIDRDEYCSCGYMLKIPHQESAV